MKYCLTYSAKYDLRVFGRMVAGGIALLLCIPVFMGMITIIAHLLAPKSPYDFANTFDTVIYYSGIFGWLGLAIVTIYGTYEWAKTAFVKCEELEDDDN